MKKNADSLRKMTRKILEREEALLFPGAARSSQALREIPQQDDYLLRGPFARDRDRIIYSGAFRRYSGKTQVIFFAPLFDEQLSTRSNHAIQVSQVAKTIARMLRLNLDLTGAVAPGARPGSSPLRTRR